MSGPRSRRVRSISGASQVGSLIFGRFQVMDTVQEGHCSGGRLDSFGLVHRQSFSDQFLVAFSAGLMRSLTFSACKANGRTSRRSVRLPFGPLVQEFKSDPMKQQAAELRAEQAEET